MTVGIERSKPAGSLRGGIVSALCSALIVFVSGCTRSGNAMNVEVVVFNYNPQAIGELVVQGAYVGGVYWEYGPGGTGGGSVCCIEVSPGQADVEWVYGGVEGAPRTGEIGRATGVIPEPDGNQRYLGVHVDSDGTVELRLTGNYPLEKKYD